MPDLIAEINIKKTFKKQHKGRKFDTHNILVMFRDQNSFYGGNEAI